MKNSKGFVYFLIFSLIAGLVSCDTGSNDNNNIALFVVVSQKIQEAQKASALKKSMVRMSGKISMPEGAVPSEFIEAANAAGKNSTRGTGIDVSNLTGYTYFIETKNSAGETFDPDYDFDNTDGTFTITLLPGTWKLKAGIKNGEGTTVYISDEITQTVTAEDSVFNKTFVLHPLQKSDGEGDFKITMTVSEKVKKVVMKFVSGDSGKWEAAGLDTEVPLTVSGTTVRLPGTTVTMASGSYTVRFLFYDSTAEYPTLLFSSYQTINIYDGLTSDKWNASTSIGDAVSVIDSSGNFAVTDSLVNSYMISNIYVASAANGGNDNNAGSYYGPVATLNKAFCSIASYGNASGEYTINIKGELSGNFEVPDSINSKAQKITICGANEPVNGVPVDTLTVDTTGTVLKVVSTVPVEIKNLKITGGNGADCGGGIYAQGSGVEVTLGDGALVIENYAKQLGGGVYLTDSAQLIINTGAKITKNNVTDENVNGNHGGMALCAVSATVTMNGGEISENKGTETNHRGPIRLKDSSIFDLNGGLVSGNSAIHMGGCFYLEDNSKLNMIGGEISGCQIGDGSSYDALGGAVLTTGTSQFNMSGGKICGNKAKNTQNSVGAGVCVWSAGSSFNLSGGSIEGNTVESGNKWGGAVAVYPNAIFNISGGARIPYDGEIGKNDVYLIRNSENEQGAVTIKGDLTSSDNIVATITPQNWVRNSIVLKSETAIITNEVASRFKISDGDFNINKNTSNTGGFLAAPIYVAGQGTKGTDYFVCSQGGSTASSAAGTKANPYATLTQALGAIDGGGNEVIYIDGKIVGKSEIPGEFTTEKCSRLTLKGASYLNSNADGSPKDALDGNYADRTLVISSAVPVVIENLKITRGWSKDLAASGTKGGGGIRLNENACLELSDGAMVTENYARLWGGGIFVQTGASLYMNGSSYVGDYIEETASHTYVGSSDAPSEPDSCCSNKAGWYGGGIYSHGSVYLGYKNEGGSVVESDWTGGVCRNSSDYGGGLYLNEGSLKISSGNIAYNYCTKNGGAIGTNETNVTNLELLGGEIKENAADLNGNGGAIYVAKELSVQGNVSIPFGVAGVTGAGKNDIYLAEGKTITVAGTLTPPSGVTTVATITPYEWKRGTEYLSASSSNATALSDAIGKFKLSQDDSDWDRADNISTSETAKKVWITSPIYVASSEASDSTRKVCSAAPSSGYNGTKTSPYATIAAALADSELSKVDNTITIDGTISAQIISSTTAVAGSATSINLQGYKENSTAASVAKISGGNTSTALSLAKTGLTTIIQDLTIIGGNATNGGGINITSGTVKLGDGAIVTGNTATSGGGVYVGSDGTLFMSGKALIGDSATSTTRASSSGASYYANKATNGAGIYNNGGAVYIGCDTSGQSASGYTLVNNATDGYYGVRRNYSVSDGAGIYHVAGTLKIASGDISYNFANTNGTSCGGAALLAAGATVSGGTFTGNKAANGGAFYIKSGKELTINGAASITSNEAVLTGGAISNDGILTMSAGTIGAADVLNSVTSNVGGAIYQNGKFTISGSAVVYAGTGVGEKINDVYLSSTYVTVGSLSSTSEAVAAITPASWKRGTTILSSTSVLSDDVKACFHLSKDNLGWDRKDKSGTGSDTNKYVYITSPIYVVGASGTGSTKPTGFEYGKTTGANGTKTSPYASIADALTATDLANATEPNTIIVAGTLVGAQQEVSSPSVDITIKGYKAAGATKSDAKIQRWASKKTTSQDAGSVLIVNASGKTVTITDLTLSYGASSNGGGIYITNGTVKLGDYAKISENYAGNKGGGVYVSSGATLFMYGKALIGDKLSTDTGITTATGQNYGNAAPYQGGGGIYNEGSVYIGYDGFKADGTTLQESVIDAGYGIIRCFTMNQDGGAIYNNGTLKIKSGSISYNRTVNSGGAVVCVADATISGGTFESNYAGVSGGAVSIKASKTLTINGDAIFKNNQAESGGGAISNLGTLTMTAGTIGESGALNRIAEGKTGSGGAISQKGTFNISGSAQVYSGTGVGEKQNDVYLASGKTVTAGVFETGGNSSSIPMVITPYSWTRGSTAVTAATGVTLDATKLKCFKMSDEDWNVVLHSSAGKIDAPVYVASDTSSDGFMVCTGLGSDTDGTGSRAKPYATIAKALSKAWDTSTTKTIPLVIKIDGEVKGAQTISGTINAQRVIVSGASSSYYTKPSVLNGGFDSGSPGTTLTVTTSTPVFLNRITIKGGYNASGNGGGLSISGSASIVDMQCAWIEGNYAMSGGGVYVASGCSFYFEDYGCIGSSDDNLTVNQIDSTTGLTRGVNKAYNYGAGVYNQGTFYMGYTYNISTGNAEDVSWDGDLNPLVTKNYCYNNGGGVCTVGSMKMSAGKVSINKAPNGSGIYVKTSEGNSMTLCGGTISSNRGDSGKGGGMYVDNGASVIVESGVYDEGNIISGNTAKSGGGVYVAANGSFEIKNNSPMYIYGNISSDGSTSGGGGGVYVANNGIFEMRYGWIGRDENGTINPNFKTRDGKGSGVYIGGTGSQFNMSYRAHVDVSNDVYVPSGAFIGVRWTDTVFPADPPPAIITPATYSPSWVIVKDVDEDHYTSSISNFKVTPSGTQKYKVQAGGPNTGYFVTDN